MNTLSVQQISYLNAMEVTIWVRRTAAINTPAVALSLPSVSVNPASPALNAAPSLSPDDWKQLNQAIINCNKCNFHSEQQPCFLGSGQSSAPWLIVIDAPNIDTCQQPVPMINETAQLFSNMLRAINVSYEEIYIAPVIKSHQARNRTSLRVEIKACFPYLAQQITLVQPQIILALGVVAAQTLLATTTPIGSLRGRPHRYGSTRIPLVITYHPDYLLREPQAKSKVWDDLRLAWRIFHHLPPDG